MNKFIAALLFLGAPAFGSTNQLDFLWGRGTPLESIQGRGSAERDGLRGTIWYFDALHQINERFSLGVGFERFTSADNNSSTFIPMANSDISSRKTSTLLMGRMDLLPGARYAPYAIAGVGWAKNSLTATSDDGTLLDETHNAFGYTAGLGLDVSMTDRLFIGIEARYEGSPPEHFGMTSAGAAATGETSVRTSMDLFLVALKAGVKY